MDFKKKNFPKNHMVYGPLLYDHPFIELKYSRQSHKPLCIVYEGVLARETFLCSWTTSKL